MVAKSLLFALLAGAALPAAASPWIDDIGRSSSMSFPGAQPHVLAPNGHSVLDGVTAFKAACVDTAFDKAAVGAAAGKLGWGFAYREQIVPFKTPVDIGGWEATDASLHSAKTIFFNKRPQCNLTFAPSQPTNIAEVEKQLSVALGNPPSNADKAVDKKGRPNRRYEPEWRIAQPDGTTNIVFARMSPTIPGAVHLAMLNKATKR